uniref:BPTI/Kunitz inhibitor domain-containing protein n=1 Tax=Seriola dumerili TaxID=41447 RepID=A0A3B4VF89_SERDU
MEPCTHTHTHTHTHNVTTVISLSCLHPDVCSLRHEAGSCRNYTLMWFFNSSRRRCSPFWYSGCGGNENRFKTQRECETVCVTPGGREDVFRRRHKIAQCQLDADAGLQCEDYVQAWFYDKHIAACTPFWYGGCGGNANRFNTEHECFQTCGTNSKSCLQPTTSLSDPGTCQNYTMMWFFDTEQNECSRFWYGGCGGNENRFKTQEECENLCLTKKKTGRRWRRKRKKRRKRRRRRSRSFIKPGDIDEHMEVASLGLNFLFSQIRNHMTGSCHCERREKTPVQHTPTRFLCVSVLLQIFTSRL